MRPRRCAVGLPGNASRMWRIPHIQAHQPSISRRPAGAPWRWPAWKCGLFYPPPPPPHTHNTPTHTHTGQARSAAANQDTRANGQRAHVARRVSGARTRRGQGACYGWTSLGHPCRPYLTPPCPPPGTRCVLCVIERGRTSVAKITHIVPL